MTIKLIFVAFVVFAIVQAAQAFWSSAGWYVVIGSGGAGSELVSGPFTSEEECNLHIAVKETEHCVLYEKQPEWEK